MRNAALRYRPLALAFCALFVLSACGSTKADIPMVQPSPVPSLAPSKPAAALPIPLGRNGVFGNTLCLNAIGPNNPDTYKHMEDVLGRGAVEALGDDSYKPAMRHIVELTDEVVGAHFGIFSIYPTDTAGRFNDRSRTEIKFPPDGVDTFKAKENEIFTYDWRFKLDKNMKLSPSFTHVHQIKAYGGKFSDPPLITITPLINGTMQVRHVGNKVTNSESWTKLGEVKLDGLMGEWLTVSEQIQYAEKGSYLLTIKKQDGTVVLDIHKTGLEMWREGAEHMRPKWGIYRKYHDALLHTPEAIAAGKHRDFVYYANFAITRGAQVASCSTGQGR